MLEESQQSEAMVVEKGYGEILYINLCQIFLYYLLLNKEQIFSHSFIFSILIIKAVICSTSTIITFHIGLSFD